MASLRLCKLFPLLIVFSFLSAGIAVAQAPDLTVTLSHSPDPFVVGSTATYTMIVSNVGNVPTSGTVGLRNIVPTGMTAIALDASGWTCPPPPSFMDCSRSDSLAAGNSYPAMVVTVSVDGIETSTFANRASVSGGGETNTANDDATDVINIIGPSLTITKSHTGTFTTGQTGTYTFVVGNVGSVPTNAAAKLFVGDSMPPGLVPTAASGTGWTCTTTPASFGCNRSDSIAVGSAYPPITVTVNIIGDAQPAVVNTATTNGGGDLNVHSASDPTSINVPDLQITKSHIGNFFPGQIGATYNFTITNVGTIPTVSGGNLFVLDNLPVGLPPASASASGSGWGCLISPFSFTMQCSRPVTVLAPGSSYPPITLTTNVSTAVSSPLTNTVKISGIGLANPNHTTATDTAQIVPLSIIPSTPTSVTVTAGNSATITYAANLPITPNPGTVTFSVSGLPANSKGTFNPASMTQSGSVALTLDTSGNGHVATALPLPEFKRLTPYIAGILALFSFCGLDAHRRAPRRVLRVLTSFSASALILCLAGCGGGGSTPPPPLPPVVTPSGTYTVMVTATSSNATLGSVSIPSRWSCSKTQSSPINSFESRFGSAPDCHRLQFSSGKPHPMLGLITVSLCT